MADVDEGFAAELRALRVAYALGLSSKLEGLDEALAVLRAAPGEPDAAAQARALAHRLGGTAGSYGFVAVGDAASALEALLSAPQLDEPAIDGAVEVLRLAAEAVRG